MVVVSWLLFSCHLLGNDGSGGAVPAGGIQLRREARISMEKERLTIGMERVAVEYEFLNTTGQDITTEVLFPLPAEHLSFSPRPLPIDGWHVWVEGKELPYETEVRATNPNGVDQTDLLRRLSIDIASYDHFDQQPDGKVTGAADKLSTAQREELTRAGLLLDNVLPTWTVFKTYHWRQTFPAHKILHVRHEYAPASGLQYLSARNFQKGASFDSCVGPELRKLLIEAAPKNRGPRPTSAAASAGNVIEGMIDTLWVDYILTTANTWKTPIKDFELVVEKSAPQDYVSFCWDGKVEQLDNRRLVARVRNFVPKRELKVTFFQVWK
jgi:hypothetical protein